MVETLEAQARAQEAQGNQVGLLETLSTLATVLRELDEGRARSALEQAYRVALTIQDQQGMAPSLRQLGFLYHLQGGWDRALELYHRALALQREAGRSEEHTSELQSQSNLVCRLLLEKKKKKRNKIT